MICAYLSWAIAVAAIIGIYYFFFGFHIPPFFKRKPVANEIWFNPHRRSDPWSDPVSSRAFILEVKNGWVRYSPVKNGSGRAEKVNWFVTVYKPEK